MQTPVHGPQRPIVLRAVRDLIRDARAERATLAAASPLRRFYLGVEAAAEEVLHPELASARAPGWLDRETAAFREGYLETSLLLSTALTAARAPLRLPLPVPGGAGSAGAVAPPVDDGDAAGEV